MPMPIPLTVTLTRVPLDGSAETIIRQSFEDNADKARIEPFSITRSLSTGDPEIRFSLDNPWQRYDFEPGDGLRVDVYNPNTGDEEEVWDGFVAGIKEDVGLQGRLQLRALTWNSALDLIHLDRLYQFETAQYLSGMAGDLATDLLPDASQDFESDSTTGTAGFKQGQTLRSAFDHIRHALTDQTEGHWEYEYHKPGTVTGEEIRFFTRDTTQVRTIEKDDLLTPVERDHGSVYDVANRVIVKGAGQAEAGTKLYVAGANGTQVIEYDLTAWDVGTATLVQTQDVSTNSDDTEGLFFRSDGKKLYIPGDHGTSAGEVSEYDLNIAWDISTLSFVQSLDVSANNGTPRQVFFRSDGLKMYVVSNTAGTDVVGEYTLSTAWDVSTASHEQTLDVSGDDTDPESIFLRSDGRKLYMVGGQNDNVYEYDLSTPWDVSTASLNQSADISTNSLTPVGVTFRPDGVKMYVVDGQDHVDEYTLTTAWDVSSLTHRQAFDVGTEDGVPREAVFRVGVLVQVEDTDSQSTYENLTSSGVLPMVRRDTTIEEDTQARREAQALLGARANVTDGLRFDVPYDPGINPGNQVDFGQELEDRVGVSGPFDVIEVEHVIRADARTRLRVAEHQATELQALKTVAGVGSGRTLA